MTVQVKAARIPDRDRLLRELCAAGLEARAVGEVGIVVPYRQDAESTTDEVFAHAEAVIVSVGAPFVPIEHEGVIYIRPPVS